VPRRLRPEERALWEKVIASVRPLHPRIEEPAPAEPLPPTPEPAPRPRGRVPAPRPATVRTAPPTPHAAATLDGSWDRRLSRGLVQPDAAVDLHGHSLSGAWHLLDTRLEQAIAGGARVLLLITGKPPRSDERPARRGAIRAAVEDWLGASRHSDSIAAVRAAHPRHGGAGALYIILKRRK
jgi:DNA-nicking Smr family endonuclease